MRKKIKGGTKRHSEGINSQHSILRALLHLHMGIIFNLHEINYTYEVNIV